MHRTALYLRYARRVLQLLLLSRGERRTRAGQVTPPQHAHDGLSHPAALASFAQEGHRVRSGRGTRKARRGDVRVPQGVSPNVRLVRPAQGESELTSERASLGHTGTPSQVVHTPEFFVVAMKLQFTHSYRCTVTSLSMDTLKRTRANPIGVTQTSD